MKKRSKYFSKKVVIDGIKFDSKKESQEYLRLKVLESKGIIRDLELQKEFLLQEKFKLNGKTRREINYRSDFTYYTTCDGVFHVVDVKSPYTRKEHTYRLKKKMFEYKYGIELEEI